MIYDFKASGNYFNLDFDIQLERDQQVYCFIGENGVGKTKLLQTLANFSLYKHSMFDYYQTREDVKYSYVYNSGIFDQIKHLTINIPDKIYFNDKYTEYDYVPRATLMPLSDIDNRSMYFGNRQTINKPVIFISAKNRGYITGVDDSGVMNLPTSSKQNFVNTFLHTYNSINDKPISNDSVTNWLLQRVMINRTIQGTEKLYSEALFVLKCLKKMAPELAWLKQDEAGNICDNFSYEDGKLLISGIPIEGLSTGYASILRIVQEIVAGLSAWSNDVDLAAADGIVFIDEIDLHLHPIWQYKIIDLLKEFFPKVTFYITTHSPLVLFNLKNGEGYKLVKDEKNLVTAQKIEQNNMQFIGDIIKQFFEVDGVSIRKTNKADMLQARKNLLDLIQENQDE